MSFVDQVAIEVIAGDGGQGSTAFRREKFAEFGGPYGGDGGRGGNVVLVADKNVNTLLDLRYRRIIKAEKGQPGGTKRMTGRSGEDEIIRVPVGTLVRDAHSLELLCDLFEDGQRHILAKGGKGGLGNCHFQTATHQAPRYAQAGLPGETRRVILELKLLADVGIVGYPSVGKSTLISVISNARPKIADYHFTTLTPNLGIVRWHNYSSFVVADIPGLIEGAHEGLGLGHQFLRHIERCRVLLHVIEVTPQLEGMEDEREPIADYHKIMLELERFSEPLAQRPMIVALGKIDLPFVRDRLPELQEYFAERGITLLPFSAVTREGVQELIDAMGKLVQETPAPDIDLFTVPEALPEPEPEEDWDETVPATEEEALRRLLSAENLQIITDKD